LLVAVAAAAAAAIARCFVVEILGRNLIEAAQRRDRLGTVPVRSAMMRAGVSDAAR
jgi:hypothetical protein